MPTKLFVQIGDDGATVERISVEVKDAMGHTTVYNHSDPEGRPAPTPPGFAAALAWAVERATDLGDRKLRATLAQIGVPADELDDAVADAKARQRRVQ